MLKAFGPCKMCSPSAWTLSISKDTCDYEPVGPMLPERVIAAELAFGLGVPFAREGVAAFIFSAASALFWVLEAAASSDAPE